MANTGWLIYNCIVSVSQTNSAIPLDRNGQPTANTGNKQAAYVWSGLNTANLVPGTTQSYANKYDIVGTYSVNTAGQPQGTPITHSVTGAKIAEYMGQSLCPYTATSLFSVSPTVVSITNANPGTALFTAVVTSKLNNQSQVWNVSTKPAWVTIVTSTGGNSDNVEWRVAQNTGSASRTGDINLIQTTTNAAAKITVTQAGTGTNVYSVNFTDTNGCKLSSAALPTTITNIPSGNTITIPAFPAPASGKTITHWLSSTGLVWHPGDTSYPIIQNSTMNLVCGASAANCVKRLKVNMPALSTNTCYQNVFGTNCAGTVTGTVTSATAIGSFGTKDFKNLMTPKTWPGYWEVDLTSVMSVAEAASATINISGTWTCATSNKSGTWSVDSGGAQNWQQVCPQSGTTDLTINSCTCTANCAQTTTTVPPIAFIFRAFKSGSTGGIIDIQMYRNNTFVSSGGNQYTGSIPASGGGTGWQTTLNDYYTYKFHVYLRNSNERFSTANFMGTMSSSANILQPAYNNNFFEFEIPAGAAHGVSNPEFEVHMSIQ